MTVVGSNTTTLKNILVGEVWVASGQSNMQWPVSKADNAKQEIAAADYPQIRLFDVPRVAAAQPSLDVDAQWRPCTPETVPGFSAVAYFFGRELHKELNVPVGLINTSWGGTRIEPWTPPEGFALVPALADFVERARNAQADRGSPAALYNGMVHPLVPFAIRGAIWYQGEANHAEGMVYCDKMKALIGGWRKVWAEGAFPFYYVQLAPFGYNTPPGALAGLWEAQLKTLSVPHTGMAVTVDIANIKDIHPRNKQDVGKRLALWALAHDYGRQGLVCSGPLYRSMAVEGNKVRLTFDHVGGGLASRDGKPLSWFTIAGEDKNFIDARAVIDGDTVVVHSDQVEKPAAVRFGWHKLAEPNLSNREGLPASPFRTDDW
jgi:sialate O-acetylesterase